MKLPFPYKKYRDVTEITAADLSEMGVRGLLLDIDGTLAPTHAKNPEPRFLAWANKIKTAGVRLFILSNNRSSKRAEHYGRIMDCPWMHQAHKPRPEGFHKAARILGLQHWELAVVGDQIYTDMLGARRAGMKGLLVNSIDDVWYKPLRRLVEQPFLYKEVRK
jgi:HAD superfamily phosphatase (TIGR01668 family)